MPSAPSVYEALEMLRRAVFNEATLPAGDVATPLGEFIRTAREDRRMSLQQLADKAGCTKSHLWEIEQERSRNPTIAMVDGIATALGIPFERLARHALISAQKKD